MPTAIHDLPNEVLQQILWNLPPLSVPCFQRVCHRFRRLVSSLIWRHLCETQFKFWNPDRIINEKYGQEVDQVDWRGIFIERYRIDRETGEILDSILSTQTGRIDKVQRIAQKGYDAKDCLLKQLNVDEDAEDVLARRFEALSRMNIAADLIKELRYYADAALGCLHRVMAIKEWSKFQGPESVSLEKALAAFDMFVLHDRTGDVEETVARLDELAAAIRLETPDLQERSTRQQVMIITGYLRKHNLIGIDELRQSHDLQTKFIGIALHDANHRSSPLISAAIFISVAQRLGINANPCAYPLSVVVIVKPPLGVDLDGRPVSLDRPPEYMYLDPFRTDEEIPVESLVSRLKMFGAPNPSHAFLPSSTKEMVLRTSRSILTSVQESHRYADDGHRMPSQGLRILSFADLEGAFYGSLWAALVLTSPQDSPNPAIASSRRRTFLPAFVEHFETHYPTDVSLVEEYIIPLFQDAAESAQLRDSVRVMRTVDSMPKEVKRRTTEISRNVRHRVGQVFRHRRYHYLAVITGWDVECGADEQWMRQMGVHELSRGKHQSFYHVLVEDKSVRYVAEENIEIVYHEVPHSLMGPAGRHFKRWDKTLHCFVSNIRDEYPDD